MTLVVVDASIIVKWFVPEQSSDEARQLLGDSIDLVAPDLVFAEAGNAVWKRVRMRQLEAPVARRMVADIASIALKTVPSRVLLKDAIRAAISAEITVYDALYLVLAVRLGTQLVTADERLSATVSRSPVLRDHIRLVSART